MINVSSTELEFVLCKMDDALLLHDNWRAQVQRTLVCRLPPPRVAPGEPPHQQCAFGQWLYAKSNAQMLAMPAFRGVEAMFAMTLAGVELLYQKQVAGRVTDPADYDAYMDSSGALRAELVKLKERIAFTLHNLDTLTGVFKRANLFPYLRGEQQRMARSGHAYSLFLIDLDLKQINQQAGREAGDRLLQTAIAGVRGVLSEQDRIYRLVGAEFVICLPGKRASEAEQLKDALLAPIGAAIAAGPGGGPACALNYGIVELRCDASLDGLLDQMTRQSYNPGQPLPPRAPVTRAPA